MIKKLLCCCLVGTTITACNLPPYIGKFKSTDCIIIDYIRVYPDKTADIKFHSINYEINWPLKVINDSTLRINDEYEFVYQDSSLIETSRIDIGCTLKQVK